MHFHLPKPLHGWREFAGEVGVIVIGVLIAIGAEQAVEAWHWHDVVSAEREVLDHNIADQWEAMHWRVEVQPCVDRRLAELAKLFAHHDEGQPLGRAGLVGRPLYSTFSPAVWDMAVADQSFAHMPVAARQRYAAVQESDAIFNETVEEERSAWRSLQQLNHAERLSPAAWDDVRKAYDAAVDSNAVLKRALITNASTEWLAPFKSFPLPKHPPSLLGLGAEKDLCRPVLQQ
jgi:hypothetical protein